MAAHRPQKNGYSLPPMFHSHLPLQTRWLAKVATSMNTAVAAAAYIGMDAEDQAMARIHSAAMAV